MGMHCKTCGKVPGLLCREHFVKDIGKLKAERDLAIEQRDAWRKAAEIAESLPGALIGELPHGFSTNAFQPEVNKGARAALTQVHDRLSPALKAARELMGEE